MRHGGQPGDHDDRPEYERLAAMGWEEWGGELIFVVGCTSGGAPYGLRTWEFEPSELEAMGLDPALATPPPSAEALPDWSDPPF